MASATVTNQPDTLFRGDDDDDAWFPETPAELFFPWTSPRWRAWNARTQELLDAAEAAPRAVLAMVAPAANKIIVELPPAPAAAPAAVGINYRLIKIEPAAAAALPVPAVGDQHKRPDFFEPIALVKTGSAVYHRHHRHHHHLAKHCKDCGIFKATWKCLPCLCVAVCGRCAQIRKHYYEGGESHCPVCNKVNRGRFLHV